jgi:phosphoglycerate dehydrogenase-like enzyme
MSARKRIVVLDDYEDRMRASADWSPVEKLADVAYNTERLRGDALVNAVKDANAIVLIRDRTPFKALAARNIPVTNTAMSDSKPATTELTWALILAAAKRLEAYTALLRKGGWRDGKGLPHVLKGERLGIIGFGEIGRMVGEVGKAFGMELVAWSPHMTAERAAAGGAKSVTLEELLKTSKVVTLHLVPSEETRKLLNAERLAMMRPDSILANTARSALIDMKALDEALAKGRPGFAALDVYDDEPLAAGYALARRDNVVLSPHLGFVNDSSFEKFASGSVENLVNWLEGRPLVRVQTG